MTDKMFDNIMKTVYEFSLKTLLVGRLRSKLHLECIKKDMEQIQKHLETKGTLVLDLGCQTGYITAYLASKGYKTIGLDVNCPKWQVQLWKELTSRFKNSFIVGDGNHLPLRDKTFGAIICYGTIEHIHNNGSVFEEVNRILDDSGLFFIFGLPKKKAYTEKLASIMGLWHHDRLYDKNEICNLLKRYGFQIEKLEDVQVLPVTPELWNIAYVWLLLAYIERILTRTPLKLISHSLTVISRKSRLRQRLLL